MVSQSQVNRFKSHSPLCFKYNSLGILSPPFNRCFLLVRREDFIDYFFWFRMMSRPKKSESCDQSGSIDQIKRFSQLVNLEKGVRQTETRQSPSQRTRSVRVSVIDGNSDIGSSSSILASLNQVSGKYD